MGLHQVAVVGVHGKARESGGAERFYEGLTTGLKNSGVDAEYVGIPCDESTNETIEEAYLRCYDLDLSAFDGVISTKAPAYAIRHPNHVCYLTHTMRVFYDMFDFQFPQPSEDMLEARDRFRRLDTALLQHPGLQSRFVIGHEVRNRMLRFNGLDTTVLYPGLNLDHLRTGEFQHIFLPGRLHRWKRVDLVIQAMKHLNRPIELLISGEGEHGDHFRQLADGDDRIHFLGRVSDEELVDLYANALVVPFAPIREDYGYIVLEAFQSCKPVITCSDSGEPARLVKDGVSGFVCPSDPVQIASRMQRLIDDVGLARTMGLEGHVSILDIKWNNVAADLLGALGLP